MDDFKRLEEYINLTYMILPSEDLFSRAKEFSWQTFFHHSVSVGAISYQLASLIKSNAQGLQRMVLEAVERDLGIPFEDFAFLVGLVHDYVKLYSEEKKGIDKARDFLDRFLQNVGFEDVRSRNKVIQKALLCAIAVEGRFVPELEEVYAEQVVPLIRLADDLMGLISVDGAISYLQRSNYLRHQKEFTIGFVKVVAQSILQANVSEKLVRLLEEKGWTPLVLYADGLILVGDRKSQTIDIRKVVATVREILIEALEFRKRLGEVVDRLDRLSLGEIYNKLLQNCETEQEVGAKASKDRSEAEKVYCYIISKYLEGSGDPVTLEKEFVEWKRKFKPRGALIDPRSLATGIEKGSKYFDEVLSTIATSKQFLVDFVKSLDDRKKFLLLAYMAAFASKDVSTTISILEKALGLSLPRNMDSEFVRIIAIAEAYRSINDEARLQKLVETVFDELSDKIMNLDYYIERFVLTNIKSNVIDTEKLKAIDFLVQRDVKYRNNYCRICGVPLDKSSISFAMYGQVIGRGGGASEIWLHDDPPLANLERIATDKEQRIRFICPICYYEAVSIRKGYRPPFLVVALHPAVAYPLWVYLKSRISSIVGLLGLVWENPIEVARIYSMIITGAGRAESMAIEKDGDERRVLKLKITEDIVRELRRIGVHVARKEEVVTIIDDLGARVLIPLATSSQWDMSQKKKFTAFALTLIPIALSVSGGGQAGVINTLSDAYNLGVEATPIMLPHPSDLVLSVIAEFEKLRRSANIQGRQMTLEEYSVYNRSYVTLLEVLYLYGLKLFSLYGLMKKTKKRDVRIEDYALELHEFILSVPVITLSLDAPPPERLDPREGDEPLPYSGLISLKLSEVESRMSQVSKMLGEKESPSLNKLLYRYAATLRELDENLSRYKVQKPLRKGIEVLLRYSATLGEESAVGLATDKFLELVASVTNRDLESVRKKVKDQQGKEKEITYAAIFLSIFKDIADIVLSLRKELNPTQLRNLIELMLDSAYYKYRYGTKVREGD